MVLRLLGAGPGMGILGSQPPNHFHFHLFHQKLWRQSPPQPEGKMHVGMEVSSWQKSKEEPRNPGCGASFFIPYCSPQQPTTLVVHYTKYQKSSFDLSYDRWDNRFNWRNHRKCCANCCSVWPLKCSPRAFLGLHGGHTVIMITFFGRSFVRS